MDKFAHRQVNWGEMQVRATHFIEMENFLLERILQTASVSHTNHYGLLPTNKDTAVDIQTMKIGEVTRIYLKSYNGITSGGYLVRIQDSEEEDELYCELENKTETPQEAWDLVLTIDPFERKPTNILDIKADPPRYAYVTATYRLSAILHKENTIYPPNSIVVGLLRKNDYGYQLDGNYIPPALTMSSHESLKGYGYNFSEWISSIEKALQKILEKIQGQPNRTGVANSILVLSKEMLRFLSTINYHWKNNVKNLTPYQVTEILSSFAASMLTSLLFVSRKEKEEMLKYFHEWNGITPSNFEQMLDEIINKKYNHNQINQSMVSVGNLLQMLNELFVSLSQLEFVGQHRESIVISERQAQTNASGGSRWMVD
ncbi:type VI secretion system baseplate subunit TssK [Capnocytophaga felis]|uniref:Type VI secretion protein n=1 Tax=Capnocytophaga felis TaxID=2267611 RepID=A0A5M4BCS0_9FLAO|nr:type VI secretion system baseplate subunit TssK [Capnocytophaga felis]GET47055.1 hypothetical protein RCZ01_23570 [Capnocytophaga felis]GET48997.1 hypothetical protein RCZ02_18280 [Capnocytophaga felis]